MPDNDKEASRTPQTPAAPGITHQNFLHNSSTKRLVLSKVSEIANIYKLNEADQINNVSLCDGFTPVSYWSISAESMTWKIFTK